MPRNYSEHNVLGIIKTPTLLDLIQRAKAALVQNDYNFAAEIELLEGTNEDSSVVIRRVLRDFMHRMEQVNEGQWTRYAVLYQKHRESSSFSPTHYRIHESGQRNIDRIVQFIESKPDIFEIVSVKEKRGYKLPASLIVICALAEEIDFLSVKDR